MKLIIFLFSFYGILFGCGCVDSGNAMPIAEKATNNYKNLDDQLFDEIKELNTLFTKAKKLTETHEYLLNESTKYQQVSFDRLNFTLDARQAILSIYGIKDMFKKDVTIRKSIWATLDKPIYRYKNKKIMPTILPNQIAKYIKAKKPIYQSPRQYTEPIGSKTLKTLKEEIQDEIKADTQDNEDIDFFVPTRKPLDRIFITSPYGFRFHPVLNKRKFHKGVDLRAAVGNNVYATADGIVERAKIDRDGYGKYIMLKHPTGYISLYAHLHEIIVSVGQRVKRGDLIALSGNTGRSTASHLHYEIRYKGKPLNPTIED